MDDRALRRAGLDYRDKALTSVHVDFDAFRKATAWAPPRLVLMTTKATTAHTDFQFQRDDVIMMGRETSGAPDWLHGRADARLIIPMMPDARSLNMAVAAGLVVGEALRQTNDFPNTMPQTLWTMRLRQETQHHDSLHADFLARSAQTWLAK